MSSVQGEFLLKKITFIFLGTGDGKTEGVGGGRYCLKCMVLQASYPVLKCSKSMKRKLTVMTVKLK